jgi:peptide deformylase
VDIDIISGNHIRIMKFDRTYLLRHCPSEGTPVDKEVANKMMAFMRRHKGCGLAANQVGLPYRLFVMHVKDRPPRRCFNPRIVDALPNRLNKTIQEGCLSYPDIFKIVPRYTDIFVEYTNQEGKLIEAEMNGLEAICFQHELDHLNGIEWEKS